MGDPYIPPNRSLADSEEFTEVFRELQTVAIQISNAGPVGPVGTCESVQY